MTQWTVHAPTILETQLTGYVGAVSRDHRGKIWRADYQAGKPVTLTRDGAAIAWQDAPRHAHKLAKDGLEFFTQAHAMRGA